MCKQLFISIPLDITDVHVPRTELAKDGESILTIENTPTSTTVIRGHPRIFTCDRLAIELPNALSELTESFES